MPFFGIGGSRQWLWVSKMAFFCIGGFRKCHFVVQGGLENEIFCIGGSRKWHFFVQVVSKMPFFCIGGNSFCIGGNSFCIGGVKKFCRGGGEFWHFCIRGVKFWQLLMVYDLFIDCFPYWHRRGGRVVLHPGSRFILALNPVTGWGFSPKIPIPALLGSKNPVPPP